MEIESFSEVSGFSEFSECENKILLAEVISCIF